MSNSSKTFILGNNNPASVFLDVETLKNNETIYEIFQNIGIEQAAEITIPESSTVLYDRYVDGIDALVTKLDSQGRPIDEPVRDAEGQVIYVEDFQLFGGKLFGILSAIPTEDTAFVYQVKIKDINKANIPLASIVNVYSAEPPENYTNIIRVDSETGDFDNIQSALSYCNSNSPSETNRFLILLSPEVWEMSEEVELYSYISILGLGSKYSTIIKATGNHNIFGYVGYECEITNIQFQNVASGYKAINTLTTYAKIIIRDVFFKDCDICLNVGNLFQDIEIINASFTGTIGTAIKVLGGKASLKNIEYKYDAVITTGIDISGSETVVKLLGLVNNSENVTNPYLVSDGAIFENQEFNKSFLGSGILKGLSISINTDTTKFDISSGVGLISDSTSNEEEPILKTVYFAGAVAVTPTYLTTHNVTYVGVSFDGTVYQSSSPLTATERRTYISLGAVIHSNRTIVNAVNNLPDVVLNSHNQFYDFLCALGNFNVSGNVFSANGANLYLNKSEGYIFKKGVNFENDNKNPHIKSLSSLVAPTNIRYRLSDGTEYAETQSVSKYYESPLGTRTVLANNRFSIQRIVIFPSNLVRIQYGQAIYASMAEALQNIFEEPFTYEQNILENGLLRGFLIIKGDATSLQDTNKAKFIEADRFGFSHTGSAAGGTTTLQQAYDNSIIPQILVSETNGEVTIQNNRTLDSSLIQQWLNKAGTWIANLTGEGLFTAKSLKIGDIDGGNYAEIQTNGELRLYGTATQWDDLRVPVLSTKAGGSKEPYFSKVFDNGAGSQGVFSYLFDASTEEELYFMVQLPRNWKQGSDIEAHVHWLPTVNGAAGQDVCWGLEYTWANIGSVFGNTTIIYGDTNHLAETLVADKHYITELGRIDATDKTFSSMIICRILRDATGAGGTDDYPNDAALLEIDFHYQIDSLGSDEEYIKYN